MDLGGGIPGAQWGTVWDVYAGQWAQTGADWYDDGVVWGLPQWYYNYDGCGDNTGWLSYKKQKFHECYQDWNGDNHCVNTQAYAHIYLHDDGSMHFYGDAA